MNPPPRIPLAGQDLGSSRPLPERMDQDLGEVDLVVRAQLRQAVRTALDMPGALARDFDRIGPRAFALGAPIVALVAQDLQGDLHAIAAGAVAVSTELAKVGPTTAAEIVAHYLRAGPATEIGAGAVVATVTGLAWQGRKKQRSTRASP